MGGGGHAELGPWLLVGPSVCLMSYLSCLFWGCACALRRELLPNAAASEDVAECRAKLKAANDRFFRDHAHGAQVLWWLGRWPWR